MLITFFVAFSTCQSNVSGWGLFCFRVAGAVQDAPSRCNYGSIIVLAQKHLLSPCDLHFPISLENFVDPNDLLFSMTSQCTQLFLLHSPVSPSTPFFFFPYQHLQCIWNFSSSAYQINISPSPLRGGRQERSTLPPTAGLPSLRAQCIPQLLPGVFAFLI